jgi:hypothetical protein
MRHGAPLSLPNELKYVGTISGNAKGLYLNHVIYEKMRVNGLCKEKDKKMIIMVKYSFTENVIIIV